QGAGGGGGGAEHQGDKPPAVTRRGGDEIEAGGADEAGFHAVGAGIAADQGIVVPPHHFPHADAGKVPIVIVFRQFADDGARQDGEVARGGNLVVGGQAVRVDEARLDHAEVARGGVKLAGEVPDRT